MVFARTHIYTYAAKSGICPSFNEPFLSRRANPSDTIRNLFFAVRCVVRKPDASMCRTQEELGPYKVDKATNELERAQYSWSTHANLLFVDQPVGTGEAHWGGSRRSCRTDHCQYRILTALRAHPGRPKASEETHIVFAPGSHSHATPTLTTEARWWGRRLLVLHRAQGHGAL